jgi:hypothetical protein
MIEMAVEQKHPLSRVLQYSSTDRQHLELRYSRVGSSSRLHLLPFSPGGLNGRRSYDGRE